MGLKLLITGFPGWLSSRFLETLPSYGTDFSSIRCMVQPANFSHPSLKEIPWETAEADLSDEAALRNACRGRDVILHTAGLLHVKKIQDFYRVNRDGTQRLLEAAVSEGVSKFILISTNAAQGFCGGPGSELDESSPCRPLSHYGKSKRQAELVTQAFHEQGRIRTVILRPAMFYGPPVPERHLNIYRRIQRGKFPVFGTGDYLRSITYIDNLIQAVHLAIRQDAADGEVFSITDREIPTLNEILQAMADALGVELRTCRLPAWAAGLSAGLDQILERMGIYWMLPHIVGESCRHIAYRIQKAERLLGYDPKVSCREGYRRAIAWCFEKGLLERKLV